MSSACVRSRGRPLLRLTTTMSQGIDLAVHMRNTAAVTAIHPPLVTIVAYDLQICIMHTFLQA